jgi:predicted nucleic acid-binding protein
MIVLDTNVLSQILPPAPEHRVTAWLEEQPRASIFTSAATQGEILCGIRLVPNGQRRKKLSDAAVAIFTDDFSGRVLSFDED